MDELLKQGSFLNYIIRNIREYFIKKQLILFKENINENIKEILNLEITNLNNDNQRIIYFFNEIYNSFFDYSKINNFLNLMDKYKYFFENLYNKNNDKNIDNILNTYYGLYNLLSTIDSRSNGFILLDILNRYSDENYIVGGYIRDSMLGKKAKDIDIVSLMDINKIEEILSNELSNITNNYNIKNVGKHFGVLLVTINGESFEIANPRKDIYNNGTEGKGASDVVIINSIIEDSKRRDFTINQLYYNYKLNYLLDFNDGIQDLTNNEINFIGKPEDRIKEDVLRILRVYKFINKGFQPSNKTIKAVRSNFHLLCEYGNSERIRETIESIIL